MAKTSLELCRLCLKKSEFSYSLIESNVRDKFEYLALIEINEHDNLPTECCETCIANIYNFYKFKQEVLKTDKILRSALCITKTDPEVLELAKESPELFEVLHVDEYNSFIPPKDEKLETLPDLKCEPMYDDKDNLSVISAPSVEQTQVVDDDEDDKSFATLSYSQTDILEYADDKFTDAAKKQNATLSCEKCKKTFHTRRKFQRHLQGHKVEMCSICHIIIRKDHLKKHMQMHEGTSEICDICGKLAKNRESLRGHIYYTHRQTDKRIKCEHCTKEFKHNNSYQAHVRGVHLAIRNQQCHLCGKKFSNGHALRKHINMTHNRARPHMCQFCKKCFSSTYALKTHARQHTQETPYGCNYCDQAFRQKVSLVTHLKSKHSVLNSNKMDYDIKSESTIQVQFAT